MTLVPEISPASTKVVLEKSRRIRPEVRGKFLFSGDEKLLLRGVTYGTFALNHAGEPYPEPAEVARDFDAMRSNGVNAVRLYTAPPRWLLDAALERDLWLLVGLPWEQHVTFLDDAERARSIRRRVREAVRVCAGHPAVLAFAVGNEIPVSIVRWHGKRRVERFLEGLARDVKTEDPGALVTYVNYPTTEWLEPEVDFIAFNVYLETQETLSAYLARLQTLAGERPLVMAEVGLDSRSHGLEVQAETLLWQLRTVFGAGCAGTFVFAWTDAWHRGGLEVEGWDFGLTTRAREPKPALRGVRHAYVEAPFPDKIWPRVSVVVCSYNGARTLHNTLQGLERLEYPDVEVIVVDDGSLDATAAIAETFDVRLIRTPNRGLSSARNTGLEAATGKIVAYLDDDAYPDPHWLHYLAHVFSTTDAAGVGGPNLLPPEDSPVAECVANAPGGPTHVLLTDRVAEHLPGCNMAFRRAALLEIGGFDPRFRTAGDDVDVCWRLQEVGGWLGFHPSAVVWHHRRASLRAYLKQQAGYGRAEALLAEKWPGRYNAAGHVAWRGRIYGRGLTQALLKGRIYGGVWGSAPFQSLYRGEPNTLLSIMLMPEWYGLVSMLAVLAGLSLFWSTLWWAVPLLAVSVAVPILQALRSALAAPIRTAPPHSLRRIGLRGLTALLHLLQPAARLRGRLKHGLSPWRRYGRKGAYTLPRPQTLSLWREAWRAPTAWLEGLESSLRGAGLSVRRGGPFDRWDLEARGGALGGVRVLMAIEEHGSGRQQARFRLRPHPSGTLLGALLVLLALAGLTLQGAPPVAGGLIVATLALSLRGLGDCGAAQTAVRRSLETLEGSTRV